MAKYVFDSNILSIFNGGKPHQCVDNTADGHGLAAENGCHAVEAEQPHGAPVQSADDDQYQSDTVKNLHMTKTSILKRLLLCIAFPWQHRIYTKKFSVCLNKFGKAIAKAALIWYYQYRTICTRPCTYTKGGDHEQEV